MLTIRWNYQASLFTALHRQITDLTKKKVVLHQTESNYQRYLNWMDWIFSSCDSERSPHSCIRIFLYTALNICCSICGGMLRGHMSTHAPWDCCIQGEKRSLTFVLLKQAQYHLSRPPMPSLTNHYQIVSNHPAFMSVNKQPNNRGNSCAPRGPTKHQPHCSSGQNLGICFSSKNGVKLWPNANKCQTNSIYDWLNRNHVQKLCKLKKCIAGDDIS